LGITSARSCTRLSGSSSLSSGVTIRSSLPSTCSTRAPSSRKTWRGFRWMPVVHETCTTQVTLTRWPAVLDQPRRPAKCRRDTRPFRAQQVQSTDRVRRRFRGREGDQ